MSKLTGTWNIVLHTYMGDMRSQLCAVAEGGKLTGTVTDGANGATAEISNGKVDGNKFSYDLTIRAVIGELTNHLEGELVDDNTLKGTSEHPMGKFDFEASRG